MTISPSTLINTNLPLPLFIRGKVRDSYDMGNRLLIIATDRISAFDVVLPNGIPDKGLVLNQLSAFWFTKTKNLVPNHLIAVVDDVHSLDRYLPTKSRVGDALSEELKEKSLAIYSYAREYARTRGIIIADTKLEFGLDNSKLI